MAEQRAKNLHTGLISPKEISSLEPLNRKRSSSRRPSRVFMTGDCVGGVWNYSLDLAQALGEFGVEVGIATMGPKPSEAQKSQASLISNLQLFESDYKLEWMNEPWAEVDAAGAWLLELARNFSPDIVQLNGFSHAGLDWRVPLVVVAHSCVNSWWKAVKEGPAPAEFDEYTKRVSEALKHADLVIAPTKAMLEAIDYHYHLTVPGRVVPNGRFRAEYSSGQKENFILTAGRLWDEAKGLPFLERLAPELKWPVYAAGDNCNPDGTERTIKKIHPLGHLDNRRFAAYLSTASIYVAPALYEPFGLAVLEAAFSGCALVLSDIPSFRENWSNAAILVSPTDQEAWKEAINNLINDSDLRLSLSRKGQLRAGELQPEKIGDRYFSVYSELLTNQEEEQFA